MVGGVFFALDSPFSAQNTLFSCINTQINCNYLSVTLSVNCQLLSVTLSVVRQLSLSRGRLSVTTALTDS